MFLMCAKCAFLKYRCSILGLCETHNDLGGRMQGIDFVVKSKICIGLLMRWSRVRIAHDQPEKDIIIKGLRSFVKSFFLP